MMNQTVGPSKSGLSKDLVPKKTKKNSWNFQWMIFENLDSFLIIQLALNQLQHNPML